MKEHVVEALAKKWKLPEDVDDSKPDNQDILTTEEPEPLHIADKLADKNTSLKKKMKILGEELGKKTVSTRDNTNEGQDESEDTLANDSGSNTSLKDN
jgi:HD-like signal output (HDOD) protein